MEGAFDDTVMVMMGCTGVKKCAATAFVEKGARVYVGWNGPVSAGHTDRATLQFLKHFLSEKQTITQAVSRTMEESGFAATGLPALHDVLAPAVLDVQTDGRLVRIEHHQGEYWVLTLMLAGLKTQWSGCVLRSHEVWKYGEGFFAEQLHLVLERLPPHLWSDKRRKRSYVNQVLARAEVGSSYRPARQLFARARHGYYLPNPAMLVRQDEGWVAVYDAFGLDWLDAGCGSEQRFVRTPAAVVKQLGRDEKTTEAGAPPPSGSVE